MSENNNTNTRYLRSSKKTPQQDVESVTEEATMTNVVMTQEQLLELMTNMKAMLTAAQDPPPAGTSSKSILGSFAECKSRFSGAKGESVDGFIDAISIYKDCVNVSDANALKGLPMLLDGAAATWWQGTKASVTTWAKAVEVLTQCFGEKKPNYKIFRELFCREQQEQEATDIFVNCARALLSKLSPEPVLAEKHKIDMVYGLLRRKIRKMIPRDHITTFEDMVTQAREVEEMWKEKDFTPIETQPAKTKKQCNFCRNFGHTQEECRKLAARAQSASVNRATPEAPTSVQPRALVCYGCHAQGHIRSQCPKQRTPRYSTGQASLTQNLGVLTAGLTGEFCRPLMEINVSGLRGLAYVDSGAARSIAGTKLYRHLLKMGVPSTKRVQDITMADGVPRPLMTETFTTQVMVQDHYVRTEFVAVPEHENSKTLLGVDFLGKANIVIDTPRMTWFFGNCPSRKYPLVGDVNNSKDPATNLVTVQGLRGDEGTGLDEDEKQILADVLERNIDIFERGNEPTPYAEHTIQLTTEVPTAMPPYRLSPQRRELLDAQLQEMLEDGIIEECESAYASPVVLVPKKCGSLRVCVDYRRLNAVTVPDRYPLPRIDDVLHAAKQSHFMSTIDLKSGFWQIPVREEDRDKTAFITPSGLYRFLRMPFGLRNSPATFQRLIDRLKSGLSGVFVLAYMDDIIVLSETFQKHVTDLQQVFNRLKLFKLNANREKCVFACAEVKFLGHIIQGGGITPDPSKISAIMDMSPPHNVKQLMSFLQTCSWFRRFVPEYAEVARPLTYLTKKHVQWTWGTEQATAYARLKELLTSAPILRQADPALPFMLKTDASSYALGACLLQGEGSDERPVEYASRLLTSAERNYTTTEREALAIVFGVQKFRGYLEGARVTVTSDHQPLKWLMTLRSPSGRLARWALLLQSYDLGIDYVPGRTNVIADTLSRPPVADQDATAAELAACPISIEFPTISAAELRNQQMADESVKKIIDSFESNDREGCGRWLDRGYHMAGGVLYRYTPDVENDDPQLVAPSRLIPDILVEFHNSPTAGHPGVDKTIARISRRYFWSTMRRDVRDYVRKCVECQRYKCSNTKPAGLVQTPVMSQRFEVLAIDLFGPLPTTPSGERWVLAVEDTATRWMELFPLAKATAEACAKCLVHEVILRYGAPRKIISDNGTQFVSEIMQQVAHCMGFEQVLTPVYHPAANPEERRNRELKVQLSILVENSHDQWSAALPSVRFAMNASVHGALGQTPAFLCFGREMRTPLEVHHDLRAVVENENFVQEITPYLGTIARTLKDARECFEQQQDRAKTHADNKRRAGVSFEIGDRVLVDVHALSNASNKFTNKFAPRRDGPYIVIEEKSPVSYVIASVEDPETPLGKYHVSALRPFVVSEETCELPDPVAPIRKRGRPRKVQPEEESQEARRNDGCRLRKKKTCGCCP